MTVLSSQTVLYYHYFIMEFLLVVQLFAPRNKASVQMSYL